MSFTSFMSIHEIRNDESNISLVVSFHGISGSAESVKNSLFSLGNPRNGKSLMSLGGVNSVLFGLG